MLRSSPFCVKNSLEYLPPSASFLGILPTSSMTNARWSSSRDHDCPAFGEKSRSPVAASKSTHATDQTSAEMS